MSPPSIVSLTKMRWQLEIAMGEGTTENAALVPREMKFHILTAGTPFLDAPGDP